MVFTSVAAENPADLAVQNETNMIGIVTSGAMKSLVELLLSENLDLKEQALSAMITLSTSPINKPIMAASGVIPLLVEILRHGVSKAKSDALVVLHNLSSHEENLAQLLQTDPIPPLVNVLKSTRRSSKTAGTCTALIELLMGFDEARRALADEEGGILAVVEVLESISLRNRGYAVGALLTLCQSDRAKYREPILGEGVIPGLLELTVEGTPKSRAKAQLLLKLLRKTPCSPSDLRPDAFEHIVCDIVSQIDMEEISSRSKQMFAEMVRLSMELSLKRIQNHALVLASSDL